MLRLDRPDLIGVLRKRAIPHRGKLAGGRHVGFDEQGLRRLDRAEKRDLIGEDLQSRTTDSAMKSDCVMMGSDHDMSWRRGR